MAKNEALELIRQGKGLENPKVRAYVKSKKAKRDARMATYAQVENLITELSEEPEKTK